MFVSVYPSPTDDRYSNADFWWCEATTTKPDLLNRHMGDERKFPKMTVDPSASTNLVVGGESSALLGLTADGFAKAFRGYIAEVKGWNRLLTTNEMWTVMGGHYGGTWDVGTQNDSADEFGAGEAEDPFDPTSMAWQKMKKSLTSADRTLTLKFPIDSNQVDLARFLEVSPLFDGVGSSCPVTGTVGDSEIGTFDLVAERLRTIPIRGKYVTRDSNGYMTIAITRPEGCAGTLSFDALSLSGSWKINGYSSMTQEYKGVAETYICGDPDFSHLQRAVALSKSGNESPLSFLFEVPKSGFGYKGAVYSAWVRSTDAND